MGKSHPPRGPGRARVLRSVRSPGVEFAALRGEFSAWLVAHGLPSLIDPRALAEDAAALIDAATAAWLADLHRWSPEHIDRLAEVGSPGALTTLPLALGFLADTGRWSGTQEELDAVLAAAEVAASPVAEILDELDAVSVDPGLEAEALRGLPVVGRAEALLRFLGPRRRVTSRGALGRADVVAVLELLGIERPGPPRSMWDVPSLADLWEALVDADLLDLTPATAVATPLALGWLAGDPQASVTARRRVAEAALLGLLDPVADSPWLPDPVEPVLPALAAAALDRPLPTEHVARAPGVRALLDELAAEGFVQVGDAVATLPGLRAVLARCTAELLADQLEDGPPP